MTDLATLTRIVSELTAKVEALSARTPVRVGNPQPSALVIDVVQEAHGFTVGKAVTIASGAWSLFTDYGAAYGAARPLWGIVCGITGSNSFRLTIGGEGITTSSSLGAGYYYSFNNGDPVQIVGDYPPFDGAGAGVAVMAMSQTSVVVSNDGRFDGLQSHSGTFAVVSHVDIDAGHYVVYSGVPSGESPLALADEANAWKWTNVGIALFEVGTAGTWLILVAGSHAWYSYGNGDVRPAWMLTSPYNLGQRIYLSDTNPGQYATTEPAFKVYAGSSGASYQPASPPNPETTGFYATAVGQGVPYPIPASGGGTGRDVSTLNEHSVLYMDTYGSPASRKIAGLLSATSDFAVIAQKNSEPPTHLLLDLAATGSFVVDAGVLYSRVCGKKSSTTAPTDKQILRYDGTQWSAYGPLLSAANQLLTHDGTDLAIVSAPAANNQMLCRIGGTLQWLSAPTTSGHVLQYNGTSLAWGAVSGLPAVGASDEGKTLWVTAAGAWQASRDVYLGDNPLTASSVQGSFGVVVSNDGDYIKTSSAGLEFFDCSVSTTIPLIKITLGHASLNATGRQIAVGEAHVCDPASGTVKTIMLLRSDAY